MKTHQTIAGNNYVVYSKNGGTVTDASGTLNKTVEAGDFLFIPAAPSDMLMCDDDESVIKQVNFKSAAAALRLLGGGATSGLPAGYTRVEFLESTGTQYLVLPVMVKDTSGFAVSYKVGPSANFDYLSIIRYRGKSLQIGRIAEDGKTGIATSSPTVTAFVENNGRIFATYNEYASKKMKVATQGEEEETDIPHTPDVGESVTPVYLMAYDRAANLGTYTPSAAHYSLYEARFTLGQKLVNQYVPALDSTGTLCMYDLVSKQPFRNEGSGQFIAGFTLAQARKLGKIPAGTTLTVSLPVGYDSDAGVINALAQAQDNGCVLTIQTYEEAGAASATFALRRIWVRKAQDKNGSYVDAYGQRWLVEWCVDVIGADPETLGYERFRSVDAARDYWGLVDYVDPESEELLTAE